MITKCLFKKTTKSFFVILLLLGSFMTNEMRAQSGKTVSGVVIDETGMPVPGANVVEKGTKNSASTDFEGKYNIRVSGSKSELVFSYIGYEATTQLVGQKTTLNVSLKNSSSKLDEVVIIGYGTSKKSDLTGSVATIGGGDLKKQSIPNVAETLTGRVAGVRVTSSEGSPDADINIRIRGGGSLTQDASPLYIVDGFPIARLSDVSPSDIDTMTILKDASSTAIYGSRGANGVILITTKKGKNSKVSVTYNMSYGVKELAKTLDVLSAGDYVKWQYEYSMLTSKQDSFTKVFGNYQDLDQYQNLKSNNWQKQVFGRLGETQMRDLGIRGGSDKLSYNFNYAHYDETAIMKDSDFKRDNLSLSLKSKAGEKVDLSFTMRYANTTVNGGGSTISGENTRDSRLKNTLLYAPIPLSGFGEEDLDEANSNNLVNPLTIISDTDRMQNRLNYNLLGGLGWKVLDDLKFNSDFGLNNYSTTDNRFFGSTTYFVRNNVQVDYQKMPALGMEVRKEKTFRNANTLNYDFKKILGDSHRLKVLLGEEMINTSLNINTTMIQGFPTFVDFNKALDFTTLGTPLSVNNYNFADDKLLSFFGRVNYDLNNRYLFTASYRADGSSKFLGDNRWGYFPSAAVAWKISEESFLKSAKWINSLKLRLSYGQAGNNNIPSGQTTKYFNSSNSVFVNGVSNYLASPETMTNSNLKWETTISQNLGLDFDFFKGRVSGSLEAYKNITKDLLILFPVTGVGYTNQYRNLGETQNKGIEASLNLVAIQKENYGLDFSFNIGINQNRVNSIGSLNELISNSSWTSDITQDFTTRVGQPIGLMYGYVNDGRYEVSDFDYTSGKAVLKPYFLADKSVNPDGVVNGSTIMGTINPGTMKLKDLNGDGIITVDDRKIIGNANPKHTGGFTINGNAYGFDLAASFNWSYGNDVYNANKVYTTTQTANSQYTNMSSIMAEGNRWNNIDPATGSLVTDPTALQALNANTTMWSPYMRSNLLTDWAVEDGSFLRLNTLSLGYTLPDDMVSHIGLSKLRLYATANNVFLITNYSGLDPEVSTRRASPLTPSVDYSPYPRSRQIVMGLNLNF
jgi:TonB-linked SusC/RagA family outer membrane protein